MHVGWSAVFDPASGHDRPTLAALRARVAGRLNDVEWCRWRLQRAPLGLSEPRWVRDDEFDLEAHVRGLSRPAEAVSPRPLRPVTRRRAVRAARPVEGSLGDLPGAAPGGRTSGVVGKIHHSLVDGIAALQIVEFVRRRARTGQRRGGAVRERPSDGAVYFQRAGSAAMGGRRGGPRRPRRSGRDPIAGRRHGPPGEHRRQRRPRRPQLRRRGAAPICCPVRPTRRSIRRCRPTGRWSATGRSASLLRDARAAGGGTLNDIGLTASPARSASWRSSAGSRPTSR